MNRFVSLCLGLTLTVIGFGCGDSKPKQAALVAVKGTVNLDGKPMEGGEIRFSIPGSPVRVIEIKGGTFAGEANVGKNVVEVVWEKDGPANPMNPAEKLKVNTIAPIFSGQNSTLYADITDKGASDLKFEVNSARR